MLVGARFIQGLGAGTIPPIAYVAIGRSLPERLRPRMFATLSTAWVLPGVIGPALAGLVGETLGWRYVFLGHAAVHRRRRRPDPPRDRGGPRARDERPRTSTWPATPGAGACRRPCWSASGAGLFMAGLSTGEPLLARGPGRRRPARRPAGPPAPDPARHADGAAGPAGRGPAARHPDVHVLRRGRLRHAGPRGRGAACRRSRPASS